MIEKFPYINKFRLLFSVLLITIQISGCEKFLEVKAPTTSVNEGNVYSSDETAIAVLTNIYAGMSIGTDGGFAGQKSMSVLAGLSADELTLANTVTDERLNAYYRNQLRAGFDVSFGTDSWNYGLKTLFTCNAAIERVTGSSSLTPGVRTQLLGESKFMRALLYFYLVNYYADVPLLQTTNPNANTSLPRSPKQEVYEQIVADLKDAQSLLSNTFLDGTLLTSSPERIRPTKWAATALLARTYLYMARYADAETEASRIIANSAQFSLVPIGDVFLKNSSESIWQLQPVRLQRNTEDAFTFKIPSTGPNRDNNPVYLSAQQMDAFETGDARRKRGGWVDSVISSGTTYFFPAKYKATNGAITEYLTIFRLAEQYLIRAEARAQQNKIEEARDDLNVIRTRAALFASAANDRSSLLSSILKERQVELFTELGQRWLDLKRIGIVDDVMSVVTPLKANGAPWESYQQLYPILFLDIQKNPKLTQNPGY
jgi:starch-binding outer membrane protein, SusD/RagB family